VLWVALRVKTLVDMRLGDQTQHRRREDRQVVSCFLQRLCRRLGVELLSRRRGDQDEDCVQATDELVRSAGQLFLVA
jgi:hypothetical protein